MLGDQMWTSGLDFFGDKQTDAMQHQTALHHPLQALAQYQHQHHRPHRHHHQRHQNNMQTGSMPIDTSSGVLCRAGASPSPFPAQPNTYLDHVTREVFERQLTGERVVGDVAYIREYAWLLVQVSRHEQTHLPHVLRTPLFASPSLRCALSHTPPVKVFVSWSDLGDFLKQRVHVGMRLCVTVLQAERDGSKYQLQGKCVSLSDSITPQRGSDADQYLIEHRISDILVAQHRTFLTVSQAKRVTWHHVHMVDELVAQLRLVLIPHPTHAHTHAMLDMLQGGPHGFFATLEVIVSRIATEARINIHTTSDENTIQQQYQSEGGSLSVGQGMGMGMVDVNVISALEAVSDVLSHSLQLDGLFMDTQHESVMEWILILEQHIPAPSDSSRPSTPSSSATTPSIASLSATKPSNSPTKSAKSVPNQAQQSVIKKLTKPSTKILPINVATTTPSTSTPPPPLPPHTSTAAFLNGDGSESTSSPRDDQNQKSDNDLVAFLEHLDLTKYCQTLHIWGLSGVSWLSESDMKGMGIPIGPALKITRLIGKWDGESSNAQLLPSRWPTSHYFGQQQNIPSDQSPSIKNTNFIPTANASSTNNGNNSDPTRNTLNVLGKHQHTSHQHQHQQFVTPQLFFEPRDNTNCSAWTLQNAAHSIVSQTNYTTHTVGGDELLVPSSPAHLAEGCSVSLTASPSTSAPASPFLESIPHPCPHPYQQQNPYVLFGNHPNSRMGALAALPLSPDNPFSHKGSHLTLDLSPVSLVNPVGYSR